MSVEPTYEAVVDAIYGQFETVWQDQVTGAIVHNASGYTPEIRWPNIEYSKPPNLDRHWCRPMLQTQTRRPRSFRGQNGTRYQANGIIVVEHFFSKSSFFGGDDTRLLEFSSNIFINPLLSGCIWFRESTIIEVNPEENWLRGNTSAQWEYDQIIL